jgi:hypothetical protein
MTHYTQPDPTPVTKAATPEMHGWPFVKAKGCRWFSIWTALQTFLVASKSNGPLQETSDRP